MNFDLRQTTVLHWNYRGFTEFPIEKLEGDEAEVTDIYLKENLISHIPSDICKLIHLESLYLSGNDITELPKEICLLKYLKCLDLSGNRLRRIPEEIGEVRNLKFLILDENELVQLPLRMVELRSLRYLSVCDNQLRWLPQRPVYNYHHCEVRFWRNTNLRTIPYSLWYHMFRGQQTRSLNIGCLSLQRCQHLSQNSRCKLKISQNSEFDVEVPPQHLVILENQTPSPPSLFEICRRFLYENLSSTAKRLSKESFSLYSDMKHCYDNLDNSLQEFNIENGNLSNWDLNGNDLCTKQLPDCINKRKQSYYVPADLVKDYFDFLPNFVKDDLKNGPVSRCENVTCKKPVFDYAYYEFCLGTLILIDKTEETILSAAFCSRSCANDWKRGKCTLLTWTLTNR